MPITYRSLLRIVLITAVCSLLAFAQTDAQLLEAEKPIERELAGGETHAYKISLSAGQYLYAVADQRGIDAIVSLYSPAGKKIFEIDSPNGSKGPEPVWTLAETSGEYRIEIHSPDKKAQPGRYEVSVKELRAGVPDDKYFVEAQRETATASDLIFGTRTEESRAKAKQNFENAANLFRRMENKERRAAALAKIGRITLSWLGDSEMSLPFLLEALSLFEESGKKGEAAATFLDIGGIYFSAYKYKTAIDNFEKALSLATEVSDKPLQILILNEMGMAYTMIGNLPLGLKTFTESLKISEEIGSKRSVATANKNIGLVYQKMGNYAKSLEYLEKDLAIWRELGEKNNIPAALLNIGNIYYHQSNYDLAIDYYQKALAGFEAMPSRSGIIFALDNMGSAYLNRGQYAEALSSFQRAQQTRRGNFLKDPTSILNIGLIYREQGRYSEALEYLEKATPLAEKSDVPSFMVDILNGMSGVYYAKGDFVKALELSQKATEIVDKGVYPEGYLQTLIREGSAYLALNKLKEARASFEKAVVRVENDREYIVGGEEHQQQYFEDKTAPYKALIGLSIAEGKSNEALAYAEKIKSRSLLDVLQNGRNDISKAMTSSQIETETRLKSDLTALNNQLGSLRAARAAPETISAVSKELNAKRLELEDFKVRLYAARPQLRIQRGEMNPISPDEAGRLLPNNQSALLEYVVTKDKIFLFVLTKQPNSSAVSMKVFPIEIKQKDLIEKTEKFRLQLAKGDLDFQKPAREFYDLLLKPAQAQIAGKTNLIIVPDDVLWDLPFQALQPAQSQYLIETSAISYAPSLTALREMAKKNKGKQVSRATLLAFGNPIIGKETSQRVKRTLMSERLDPLPEAERLVMGLEKLYGSDRSKIFTGAAAREETAKTESAKYRIVQFATHGILNDASPMYSYIVLAQKENSSNEDGLLEAWEMKELNLNADMVILSACETARGKVSGGEGVIGMSWALFIAGTPTTVASQWKVESSSTTELMLEFHRQLLTGKNITKAEALRRASLKLLKMPQYKHPSYWAGFVMVGDGF